MSSRLRIPRQGLNRLLARGPCVNLSTLPSGKIKDARGEIFGRLTVLEYSHTSSDRGKNAYWVCLCKCGNETTVHSGALRTGSTQSCGCLASELNRVRIKKTHNKGRHLYFIRSGPFTKIGRADRPDLRLGQIRASNPFGAELLGVLPDGGYREKAYHRLYRKYHHTGEWFQV